MKTFKVTYEVNVNEEGLTEELERCYEIFKRLVENDPTVWCDDSEDFWTFVSDYLDDRIIANTWLSDIPDDLYDAAWDYLRDIVDKFYESKRINNQREVDRNENSK